MIDWKLRWRFLTLVVAFVYRITKYYDHLIVQLDEATQLMVVYGLNHVALGMEIGLEGRVSGLCGQLNGRYLKGIPQGELYTSVNV